MRQIYWRADAIDRGEPAEASAWELDGVIGLQPNERVRLQPDGRITRV